VVDHFVVDVDNETAGIAVEAASDMGAAFAALVSG
jgi:hypothetical protein